MGRGGAWGRGRGFRNGFHATGLPFWARTAPNAAPAPDQEIDGLTAQADLLKSQLDAINQRLNELDDRG